MEDERSVELRAGYYKSTICSFETGECRTRAGWKVFARVGDAVIRPPMSEKLFETRDEALREGIAWVRLRAVHTHEDGSPRKEIK